MSNEGCNVNTRAQTQSHQFEFFKFFLTHGIVGWECPKEGVIQEHFKDGWTAIQMIDIRRGIELPWQSGEILKGRHGKGKALATDIGPYSF